MSGSNVDKHVWDISSMGIYVVPNCFCSWTRCQEPVPPFGRTYQKESKTQVFKTKWYKQFSEIPRSAHLNLVCSSLQIHAAFIYGACVPWRWAFMTKHKTIDLVFGPNSGVGSVATECEVLASPRLHLRCQNIKMVQPRQARNRLKEVPRELNLAECKSWGQGATGPSIPDQWNYWS